MLHEQVNLVLETLDVKGGDIARYADISPARMSRLRSGAEEPQRENPVMTQLVRGFFKLAAETGKTQKLYNLMGIQAADSAAAQTEQALDWLYTPTSGDRTRSDKIAHFCECFDILLELSGMTLKALSEAGGTDYSYLYRVHKGERFPRPGSKAIGRLCGALLDTIRDAGNLGRLSDITSIPPELCSAETLRDWMFDTMDFSNTAAARDLIGAIGEFDPAKLPKLPPPQLDLRTPSAYIGDAGLQAAVTQFLGTVEAGESLLLYSDHPMDWMLGDYLVQWASLMVRCLRLGVHVRIIHNVERDPKEMMEALRNWIPLYLSGLIEPYYSPRPRGERFRHTLFLRPGKAAVTGFSPEHSQCEFHYITDVQQLTQLEQNYRDMLSDCEPLLTVSATPQKPQGKVFYRKFSEAEVYASRQCAVVNKLTAPQLSFRLLHPDVVAAIRLLIEK